ncbi:uncharacterized protein LOC108157605 [Drosophila miranda]|uniref:uncharacterized protein LOC108157605 n=1 Tax=Drosophila miranda TaxID=7229 RepID=UPI0007E647A7|nr:uncharacterized protein LOC108157605 [Drosophila miranda]
MHQYFLSFVRTLSEQQRLNAVQLITWESRESYLNDGQIFMMHGLREPLVLIADEFYAKWDWHGKWKEFNLDGSNLHYLHMKLALVEYKAMGKEEINDSVSMVLDMVRIHALSGIAILESVGTLLWKTCCIKREENAFR